MFIASRHENSIRFWRCLRAIVVAAFVCLVGCQKTETEDPSTNAPKSEAVESVESVVEKGPVKLTVRMSPKRPKLSDLVTLDATVVAESDVDVKLPEFGKGVGDFIVRDYRRTPQRLEDGKWVYAFQYKLEGQFAGKHLVRAIAVEFNDNRALAEKKSEPVLLESEPLEVDIVSEWGEATPKLEDLSVMAPPKELPPKPIWIVLGGIAAVAAVAGVAAFWLTRRRKIQALAEVKKTPEEIAKEELAALLAERLPERGLFKEFYVRLTAIVRRYIERTTGIHAPEQTTEEFLRDSRTRTVFSAERAEKLANFLEAADMVKYAGQEPGQRQIEDAVARAQEFVGLATAFDPLPEPAAK